MTEKTTPNYDNMEELVEHKSKEYPDNYDFAMYLSERLEYFSDRFGEDHIKYFDLLWQELKRRLKQR